MPLEVLLRFAIGFKNRTRLSVLLSLVFFIAGCGTMPVFMDRASLADTIVHQAGFSKEYLKSGAFTLLTYQRFNKHSDKIVIYIEGDGKAWENRHQLSDDPTPSNPLALKLAALDFGRNIAYIARPGQFSQSGFPDCEATYWSNRRYSSEVVESMDRAVNVLKEKSGLQNSKYQLPVSLADLVRLLAIEIVY